MIEPVAEPDARVRVGVLGPVVVRRTGDGLVEPAGRRAKALVVALALAAPRAVSPERLTEEIWADDPPRGARAALQTLVSRLRASVGDDLIESLPSGYRLTVDPAAIDLVAAEELLDAARDAAENPAGNAAGDGADRALALAGRALALWRGDAAADLDPGDLATELAGRAAHALDGLESASAAAALALGHAASAEELARGLARRSPFDDTAHLLLMRALDAQGRSTEAVAVYAGFRERVQDAFGTSPAAPLQSLNLELLGREADGPAAAAPQIEPAVTPAATPSHRGVGRGIRAAPNELIGRDRAVDELLALLETTRVATILGPGGLGKTRVAHEVAARSLERFPLVVVVELASVRSADDVVFGIASALGIREVGTSRRLGDQLVRADLHTRILNRLGETGTLLVLDNCEHVIDAAAEWCVTLTAELPALTVLTTSRTPLAISSERVFALAPLGSARPAGADERAPGGPVQDDAVTLFLDRATAARQDAVLPPAAVSRLCARLDGLPLAIELAAARVRTMSVDEIERRLSNRFALLAGGDRSAPERHRTLLAVIEWSWNLLGRDEQRALARLSEFADGFSAEAAAAVVGGPGDTEVDALLDGLIAQSLVMVRETASGVRYRMLETVREFGQLQLERTGSRDEVRDALFAWADDYSVRRRPRMDGRHQVTTFHEISVEEDNLIDVLRRAIDAEQPVIVASVFALLGYYWSLRSAHSEVLAFSRPVYDALREYEPAADRVEEFAAVLVMTAATTVLVDLRFAVRPLSRLRRLVREHPLDDARLAAVTRILLASGDESQLIEAVGAAAASPDTPTAMLGSMVTSIAAENEGDRERSVTAARRTAKLAGELDDTWGGAMAAQMLAAQFSQAAQPEEALRWAARARAGLTALGATEDLQQLDWVSGTNALGVGDLAGASASFALLAERPGETDGVDFRSIGLAGQGEVLRAQGRAAEGLDLLRQALASFETPGHRASPWFTVLLSETLAALVIDGSGTQEEALALARRLRARTLATLRARVYADRPVLGASVVGLAIWLAKLSARGPADATGTDDPADATRAGGPEALATALELLALAESMGARQDSPSLHLAPGFARLTELAGPPRVAAARAAAAALPTTERPGRVADLLRASGPWSRQST